MLEAKDHKTAGPQEAVCLHCLLFRVCSSARQPYFSETRNVERH
jgi:hypothetical protein